MTKRLLAALLCAILVMALLPATALADGTKHYDSWEAAMEDPNSLATNTDIIKIDAADYTYGGNISSMGLTMDYYNPAPKAATVYKAGSGKVLWKPTVNGESLSSGTLTFDGATIEVNTPSGVAAVTVPSSENGVKVVFKGNNSITAKNAAETAIVFDCTGSTTFDLTGGSNTVLNAGSETALSAKGIYLHSGEETDSLEIFGSGKLTVNTVGDSNLAIEAETDAVGYQLHLTGGTLAFGGLVTGNVTLGGVTIPVDAELHLEQAQSVTKGTIGAVNNGMLVLKHATDANADIAAIKALNLTGDGYVKVIGDDGDLCYTNAGEKIHKYQMLNFANNTGMKEGADDTFSIESTHTLNNNGYEIQGDSTNGYAITLGNLLIEPQGKQENAIQLPNVGNVTVHLKEGTTTRIKNESGSGIYCSTGTAVYACTITGSGKLEIQANTNSGAISVGHNLTIKGGDITVTNNGKGAGISTVDGVTGTSPDRPVSITGGKLQITGLNAPAILAFGNILIGSGMQITSPENAKVKQFTDRDDYAIFDGKSVALSVTIEPAPSSGGDDYTPSSVTVYNDPAQPNATVWLTGSGLSSSDQLVTESNPQGSAYEALRKLADSDDVIGTYNIYLKSGKKNTGSAMNLFFNLNEKYVGNDFTLVHQKADSTHEYFYDTADANGDLTFGPLYELSPFMLVKGRLVQTAYTNLTDAPKTGDSAQTVLWSGAALIIAAALAGMALRRRGRD